MQHAHESLSIFSPHLISKNIINDICFQLQFKIKLKELFFALQLLGTEK